jgi:hypothetical protein
MQLPPWSLSGQARSQIALFAPIAAQAQEPARSFDELHIRLKPGDTKEFVVYRAPGSSNPVRVSVAPVVARRARGIALRFVF